MKKSMKKSKKF